MKYKAILWLIPVVVLAGCSSADDSSSSDTAQLDTSLPSDEGSGENTAPSCDNGPGVRDCLLPFPSNRLTVADPSTETGLRVAIPADAAPVNVDGVSMDLSDQNRADGFSPSSFIVFEADGVDLQISGVPSADDIGKSVDGSSPIVLEDETSGEPWPYWAELDIQSGLVTVRPAKLLSEGHTYRITIGDLVDAEDSPIEVEEKSWEFTIASSDSLASRLLSMLDVSYKQLGDFSPLFTVDEVTTSGGVRTIDGTFEIFNFLSNDGSPGGRLILDDSGMPLVNEASPFYNAKYRCVIPDVVASPVPTVVYGHGLLGSRNEVNFFAAIAAQGSAAACATDWLGMSSEDLGNLAGILGDMGRFGEQADRMLQGQVAFQMLGRLVNQGFISDAAFRDSSDAPILATDGAVFVGNSQGGILGGAASAVSTEWSRVVLGVPGVNYSLLLPRSSDWPQFQGVFEEAYSDVDDRLMALALAQMLWDRGENAGYVQHLTGDTYPGRQPKDVLLVAAFGDHQVANISTDLLARTIGARLYSPALASGRSTATDPFWGIDVIASYPYEGSVYVMWDYGTPAPPSGPTPPFPPDYGSDPHGAGSSEPLVLIQALGFLFDGVFNDVCGGLPCTGRVLD